MPQIKGAFLCVILALISFSPLRAANACETQSMAVLADFPTDKVCALGTDQLSGMASEWQRVRTKVCGTPASQYRSPGDALAELQRMQKQSCEAQKGTRAGALPPFEAALDAMTDGRRLDPCSYDPKANNNAILNNPMYFDYNNQSSYNNGISFRRFELYVGRADKAQAACFLALIKAHLSGTEWKPAIAALPSQPAPVSQSTPASGAPTQVPPSNSASAPMPPAAPSSINPGSPAPAETPSAPALVSASGVPIQPPPSNVSTPTKPPATPTGISPRSPASIETPSVSANSPSPSATGILADLQKRYVTVDARAKQAKADLASLEIRMTAQHLSLRSDIRETRSRLDSLLITVNEALVNGDGNKAEENLRYAENAVATIEKFLGK